MKIKKKIIAIFLSCVAVCAMIVGLSACKKTKPQTMVGQYYSESQIEYISLDVVNSDVDGVFKKGECRDSKALSLKY